MCIHITVTENMVQFFGSSWCILTIFLCDVYVNRFINHTVANEFSGHYSSEEVAVNVSSDCQGNVISGI